MRNVMELGGMPRTGIGNFSDKAREKSGELKRAPISMRLLPAQRARLEEAAAAHGRSLAQEVERRLERSFAIDDASSEDTLDALEALSGLMERISHDVGASWTDDLTAWEIVADGTAELLLAYKPTAADTAAPPPLTLDAKLTAKLRQYEAERDQWQQRDRAAGSKVLRNIMKARAGHVLTDAERLSGEAGRKAREDAPPPPTSPLNPEQQKAYDARRTFEDKLAFARAYASQFVNAIRARRGHA